MRWWRSAPTAPRVARQTPLSLEEVPIVRVLKAGVALVDDAPRPMPQGFTSDQMRTAAALGAELKDLALPKDRAGRTVVNAASVLRVLRAFRARPVGDAAEDRIPRADIDFATGEVRLDGVLWLRPDETVPAADIARDARILVDYLGSFLAFFGNGAGAIEVYWAFLVWLYSAPAAPHLRQAAVTVGIDPWVYPVYAVLFGRSSGGKTLFTRIAARSMFGFEKMMRSGEFTANAAFGLRDKLGAIPLLIDDVTRDRFTRYVPDLVRTDQEGSGQYAPVVLTTNRDVTSIPPDLTKRMVTCHIDAAIPENRSVTERNARRAQNEIGTALYRAYLQRLIPEVRAMRAEIDAGPEGFPDLLACSSVVLRGVLGEALGDLPDWAKLLAYGDYFGIRHRRFRDQLARYAAGCGRPGGGQPGGRRADHQLWRRHQSSDAVRPQRAGFRAEGAVRRHGEARPERARAGAGVRDRPARGLVAPAGRAVRAVGHFGVAGIIQNSRRPSTVMVGEACPGGGRGPAIHALFAHRSRDVEAGPKP